MLQENESILDVTWDRISLAPMQACKNVHENTVRTRAKLLIPLRAFPLTATSVFYTITPSHLFAHFIGV